MKCLKVTVHKVRATTMAVLMAASSMFLMATGAQAVTLTVSDSSVEIGDKIDVTVNFEATDTIAGINFLVEGDLRLVERTGQAAGSLFNGLVEGSNFRVFSPVIAETASYGTTVVFTANHTGPSTFMTVSFEAMAAGTAQFFFQGFGARLNENELFRLSANASVDITTPPMSPVPLPASGLYLVAALAGMGGLRARRRNV